MILWIWDFKKKHWIKLIALGSYRMSAFITFIPKKLNNMQFHTGSSYSFDYFWHQHRDEYRIQVMCFSVLDNMTFVCRDKYNSFYRFCCLNVALRNCFCSGSKWMCWETACHAVISTCCQLMNPTGWFSIRKTMIRNWCPPLWRNVMICIDPCLCLRLPNRLKIRFLCSSETKRLYLTISENKV